MSHTGQNNISKALRKAKWSGIAYAAAEGLLDGLEMAWYIKQNRSARSSELGRERAAKGDVVCLCPWTEGERLADPSREKVKLWYFPAETSGPAPYVIYLPGGAYAACNTERVIYPCAADANRAGVHVFVLAYRTKKYHGDYAPLDDLAAALRFIEGRVGWFGICPGQYMLTGLSAGGHLAGLFSAQAFCHDRYGLPAPKALTLVYPCVDLPAPYRSTGLAGQDFLRFLMGYYSSRVLLGSHPTAEGLESLRLHKQITAAYPPCYVVTGDKDFMVPYRQNAAKLVHAVQQAGVPCTYRIAKGLTHGFGLGTGTTAEGWNRESVEMFLSALHPAGTEEP